MVALELESSNRTGISGVARFAHVIDLIASWIIERFSNCDFSSCFHGH